MKKTLKNIEMAEMQRQLVPVLAQRNKIGYIAARNFRMLSDSLTEYNAIRSSLIEKYGEPNPDLTSGGGFRINIGSENFQKFCAELSEFDSIEHEVELMIARYDEVIGVLSGEEILAIDWMLED